MKPVMKEYKIILSKEGALGTLLLGASKLPVKKIEGALNEYAKDGWHFEFMAIEQHRFLLFWKREAAIITMSRIVGEMPHAAVPKPITPS